MSVETRLKNLEALAVAQGVVTDPESLASVDERIFRDQLEFVVRNAAFRKETEFSGNVQSATDGELLKALGFSGDEEGGQDFQADERPWFSVLRHNRDLPHICSEFCVPGVFREPATAAEREYFLADVRRHLGYFRRRGYRTSIAAAVGLYDFCQRRGSATPGLVPAMLSALNELCEAGTEFGYPDTRISEAVPTICEQWRAEAESNLEKLMSETGLPHNQAVSRMKETKPLLAYFLRDW